MFVVEVLSAWLLAAEPVALHGVVRAQDGGALHAGDVLVRRPGQMDFHLVANTRLESDGSFQVAVPERGYYEVEFAGVDHRPVRITVPLGPDDARVEVRLGTHRLEADPHPQAWVRRAAPTRTSVAGEPVPMTRRATGRHVAELRPASPATSTPPASAAVAPARARARTQAEAYLAKFGRVSAGRLAYQVVGAAAGGRAVNGEGEAYFYDGAGDYWSVVPRDARGRGEARWEPHTAPDQTATLRWQGGDPRLHASVTIWEWTSAHRRRRHEAMAACKGESSCRDEVRRRLEEEGVAALEVAPWRRDEALRKAWLVARVAWARGERSTWNDAALERLGPGDPQWAAHPAAMASAIRRASNPEAWRVYEGQAQRSQQDAGVVAALLAMQVERANAAGNDAEARAAFAKLLDDRFLDTRPRIFSRRIDPHRAARVGRPLPSLPVADLGGRPRNLAGDLATGRDGLTLVEFWATWCAACRAEMPNLVATHRAHPKLRIVGVACDEDASTVTEFLREHATGWEHVHLQPEHKDAVLRRFGVDGFPALFLVDAAGTIVASGTALRGERLAQTLTAG